MKKCIGSLFFKLTGWTVTQDYPWHKKQVVIGFPHTSNMDAIRAFFMFMAMDQNISTLIKKELFFWPLSWILKACGAIPVNRASKNNVVNEMAQLFAEREHFTLVIAPEATRGKKLAKRKPIKTGFWHIAKKANVPIILVISDVKNKSGGVIGEMMCSDNLDEDLNKIKAIYAERGIDVLMP